MTDATDEELVAALRSAPSGDLRAFEELVGRHQSHVLTNCRYMSGSEADAEDLAQEVLVKAFFGMRRFEGRSTFRTWLRRLKVNHCLNYLRGRQRRGRPVDIESPGVEATVAEDASSTTRRVERGEQRDRIAASLDAMPDTLRTALLMRDLDGLAYQEIADALGIGLSATKMRIKRARQAFRDHYGTGTRDHDAATATS